MTPDMLLRVLYAVGPIETTAILAISVVTLAACVVTIWSAVARWIRWM